MRHYRYKGGNPLVSKTLLNKTICVVGLDYVGLPFAEAFSRHMRTMDTGETKRTLMS